MNDLFVAIRHCRRCVCKWDEIILCSHCSAMFKERYSDSPVYKCLLCGQETKDKNVLLGPCNEPECMGVSVVINRRKK